MDIAIQRWKRSQTPFTMKYWAIGSTNLFHSPCEKGFRQRCLHNLIKNNFIVVPLTEQNFFVLKDGSVGVVANVKLVHIESIWNVNFLNVDAHIDIGKIERNFSYNGIDRHWSLSILHLHFFIYCSPLTFVFVVFFNFFAFASFSTTTFDKFRFHSHIRRPQTSEIVPIRFKLKLYAVSIKKGSRMKLLSMAQQKIVSYCKFLSKVSWNCHKRTKS